MISKGGVQQPTFGELCDAVDLLMLPQLGHHTAPLHHPLTAPLQACTSGTILGNTKGPRSIACYYWYRYLNQLTQILIVHLFSAHSICNLQ